MDNLRYYYNIIEQAIAKIGLDPQITRKATGQWTIKKGQIPVWIDVFYSQAHKRAYFQAVSPVMKMPNKNQGALALELLQLNNQFYGVAFTTNQGYIFIKTIREAEGMDMNEALAMILRVGNYADQYDNVLKKKYPDWVQANFQNTSTNQN